VCAQPVNEAALERAVVALLAERPALGWHHCGRPYACRGGAGWPDLAVWGSRFIVRELKGSETRLRRRQFEFGMSLMSASVSWAVWRPDDLESGLIAAELDDLVPAGGRGKP
jgi:hypothetical protein